MKPEKSKKKMTGKRIWTLIVIYSFIIVFVYIMGRSLRGAEWTGIGESIRVIVPPTPPGYSTPIAPIVDYRPAKTLWDFIYILLGAIVAALIAFFNQANEIRKQKTEYQLTIDKQKEEALQDYLDKISELIRSYNLTGPEVVFDSPNVKIAQIRTVTTLRILDFDRKEILIQFLRDTNLSSFLLQKAPLTGIDLSNANLKDINLSEAVLANSNLSGAYLWSANLQKANFYKADLRNAYLVETNSRGANFEEADLSEAALCDSDFSLARMEKTILKGADLTGAMMQNSILINADLCNCRLIDTNFSYSNMTNANLSGAMLNEDEKYEQGGYAILDNADLSGANLKGSKVKEYQLKTTKSLAGTILPNGSVIRV